MTPFSLLTECCGLSQREAAALLGVRPDTVQSWTTGRRNAPAGALLELARLAVAIERAAGEGVAIVEARATDSGEPSAIELGLAVDDEDARSVGWPCVGAHRAVLGRVVARLVASGRPVAIVPRGSTPATAAAADARERPGRGGRGKRRYS